MDSHTDKDCYLLAALLSLPDVENRTTIIENLHPESLHRLCVHLKKIIRRYPTHSLGSIDNDKIVTEGLKPHAKSIKKILKKVRIGKKNTSNRELDLRKQKGGALFTAILAGYFLNFL